MSTMPSISGLLELCKLKVVSLIMITAVVGMLLAVPYLPNLLLIIVASLGIALSAMSAAVFNHVVDEKIDIQMSRTSRRPLPQGKVSRNQALIWGFFLGVFGIGLLLVYVNLLTAVLTFSSLIGYAVFYTMYLKRATPQNIVIGGAAGAAPPVLGWTSVAGLQGIEYALLLFLIVFIWTPPHFWALSLYRSDDYKAAGVPMMPLVYGRSETKKQILIYSIALGPLGLIPFFLGTLGFFYGVTALVLGIIFIGAALRVVRDDSEKNCKQLFGFSILYLFLLFFAMILDRSIHLISVLEWVGL